MNPQHEMNDLEKGAQSPLPYPSIITTPNSKGFGPSTLAWHDMTLKVAKKDQLIIDHVSGEIRSGRLLAVMGPSGAGKSSFLDAVCRRSQATGRVLFNNDESFVARDIISFVEQDDALLGVLTVKETVTFAARLALSPHFPNLEEHVMTTLKSLGLQDVAHNRIGTPLQRGISGGQKRRVSIACSVVARPRVLCLDEPTSGLDAAGAREVVASIRKLAMEQNIIVLATIHQPNFATFALFDDLLLLARGKVMYNGPISELDQYLSNVLYSPTPKFVNPADHAIDLVNTEFFTPDEHHTTPEERLEAFAAACASNSAAPIARSSSNDGTTKDKLRSRKRDSFGSGLSSASRTTLIISERNVKNYTRNLLAYGVRLAMYIGMGLLLALVWINLGIKSSTIQDRFSVHFFSVAFLGFMSVAAIPSYLEERSVYLRERSNGLVTPLTYLLANTITTIPFLFICTLIYTLIMYWAIGLNPNGGRFIQFLIYLFLAVLAAESQSMLIATLLPIFVASLAIAAFANGLWMVVGGFFISTTTLPRFWYYTAHFMGYQTYAFSLLVRNDFLGLRWSCPALADGTCSCPYPSSLSVQQCALTGNDIVQSTGITLNNQLSIGVLLGIIFIYRILMWVGLNYKKR